METPSNKKSRLWVVVINDKKEATQEQSVATFQKFQIKLLNYNIFRFIATIIHDKDQENGEPKRTHLHIFIELNDQLTKRALLDQLTDLLEIDREQASIEATNNEFLGVQYLIHKNDQNKHQYDKEDIKTNNTELLDKRLGEQYQSQEDIITKAVIEELDITSLINKIGIEKANKYRPLFNQIKQEQKNDLQSLIETNKELKEDREFLLEFLQKIANLLNAGAINIISTNGDLTEAENLKKMIINWSDWLLPF